jgi:hypothetical protein
MDSQDSPQPTFGGSHHLPPYIILCAWPLDQHPNVILSWESQVVNFEIFEIRTLAILEAYNFLWKPPIEGMSK